MAETALTFLLENLHMVIVDHIDLTSGVKREVKQLQMKVKLVRDVIQKLGENKGGDFKLLEKRIIEVVYEAEDIIDYLTQAAVNRSRSFPFRISSRLKYTKLGKAIRDLKVSKLHPLLLDIVRIASEFAEASGTRARGPRGAEAEPLMLREDCVVGLEDEADTLIEYLIEETGELDVISIVGMGGLGKTTLASKIYRDYRIRNEFPTLNWVYISQDFNMKEVCLNILKQFTTEDVSELADSLLAELVRNNLEKQRFLIVLDDVWSVEDWKQIEVALPKNTSGKVLITSRNKSVAAAVRANHKREPYMLRFLNFEESWELLQLRVFGKRNICPLELEELGMQIAKQCGGVPLAIIVIGGILHEKGVPTRDLWEKVSGSVSAFLQDDYHNRMVDIISLSYNKLPHRLRDCFLYLGMFPEDTEIPAWKLTRLWIAEGFIQQYSWKGLEEAAEENLNDLVARNLVMVEKSKASGVVKTCRVHPMIREFCQNEAANMNFFQEVKKTRQEVFDSAITEIDMHRRLCIHSNVVEFLEGKPRSHRVRSFLCFSKEAINLPPKYISLIAEAFYVLRVIDVSAISFTKFPSKLDKLIHLRYIALSVKEFNALPRDVSKLWNLQTIKIDTTSREFEIKGDISKMKKLRHLKTKAAIVLNEESKGNFWENLQSLSRLSAQSLTSDTFDKAFNLNNLGIRGQLSTLMNTTCLGRLDRLQKLKLVHDVYPNAPSQNPLIGLPSREAFPPNLRILTLSFTFLKWEHMRTLGMLLTLEMLNLKDHAFVGISWKVDDGCFPSLEVLQIKGTDLEVWTASEDSFPRLRCLVLKNCESLEGIPHVLVKSLEVVDIERVSQSAVDSARRMKMEKEKMPQVQRKAPLGGFKLVIAPGSQL